MDIFHSKNMRTVDPEQWSRKLKKPGIKVTRNNFGQHPGLGREKICRASLVDAVVEFWAICSIPIVKHINMEGGSKLERYCYIMLLTLSLGAGVVIFSYNCHQFYATPPLVINQVSSAMSNTDVSFPAVALCSNNVISRPALHNYTEFLFNHPKNKKKARSYSRSEMEKNLLTLGALLFFTQPSLQHDFDQFLSDVDPDFNVTDIMFRFSPPCSSILERCTWRGHLVPCDTLFAPRVTPLGFCCVFNSRYYAADATNKPQVLNVAGINYGLGVVITENSDDFMYLRRNWQSAEMLLFEGSEYPLLESGDVRMYPVPRNKFLTLAVKVMTQHAMEEIKYFSEEHRGCRAGSVGQSGCLARCRHATAAGLCSCVPYTLHAAGRGDSTRVCMLRDLNCLSKHREKFLYLFPSTADENDPQISEEIRDGIDCECRVTCSRQLYAADISYSEFKDRHTIHRDFLTKGLSLINSSTIHLFYAEGHHQGYSLGVYATWYEVLAILSTQWMAVAGVPLVGVLELLYFCTFRWTHHFIRRKRLANLRAPSM